MDWFCGHNEFARGLATPEQDVKIGAVGVGREVLGRHGTSAKLRSAWRRQMEERSTHTLP